MRASSSSLVLVSLLTACGATIHTQGSTGGPCEAACADAARAWTDVAEGAQEAIGPEEEPLEADRALARLERHVAALERAPREVEGEEALALSSAVMDAIDAMGDTLPPGLRDRADDAAEALLTDRSQEGALRSARGATQVLEAAIQAVRPGSTEARDRRRALGRLARRARDAATAYREVDPTGGDARAERAESEAPAEGGLDTLHAAHAHAVEASSSVRRACRVSRRISLPSF